MSPIEVAEVVTAYNKTRVSRGKKTLKLTSDRTRSSAKVFILWCRNNDVPSVPFMEIVSDHMRTIYPLSRVGNATTLKFWQESLESEWLQARRFTGVAEPTSVLELSPAQEALKARYRDNPRICVLRKEMTGGFNPYSIHCNGCFESDRCRR